MLYVIVIADLLMVALYGLQFSHLPPQIPLFYSRIWGEDQLTDTIYILVIPLVLHLFFFLNRVLSKKFFHDDQLVKKIFFVVNWALIVMYTGIFVKIILLVT